LNGFAANFLCDVSTFLTAINTGQLFFFEDLSGILDELESYSRKTNEKGEVSDEIEDKSSFHGCDSLRYIISHIRKPIPHWEIGLPPKGKGSWVANAPKGVFNDRATDADNSEDKRLHRRTRKGATFDDIQF
jgi:hypothetical protein